MSTLMTCTDTLSPSRYTLPLFSPRRICAFSIEPVVVVGHRRDMDQALDEMFDELDEQAECRHAGDVAFELVADLVRHEADLLPLHQLAFGIVGAALALRRVPRNLRQVLGQLVLAIRRSCGRGATRGACGARPGRDTGGSVT